MRNRKAARWAALGVVLAFLACGGGIDTFEVTQDSTATIPQGSILEQLLGDIGFGDLIAFDISQTQEFKNQGAKKSEIDSVHLTLLRLEIVDPPTGEDFTFLDSLDFYVEAEGLPKVRIASGGPFTAGDTVVDLVLDDVDLAPYATAPSMDITTDASGHRPDTDITIQGTIKFVVDVNVSGVVCGS